MVIIWVARKKKKNIYLWSIITLASSVDSGSNRMVEPSLPPVFESLSNVPEACCTRRAKCIKLHNNRERGDSQIGAGCESHEIQMEKETTWFDCTCHARRTAIGQALTFLLMTAERISLFSASTWTDGFDMIDADQRNTQWMLRKGSDSVENVHIQIWCVSFSNLTSGTTVCVARCSSTSVSGRHRTSVNNVNVSGTRPRSSWTFQHPLHRTVWRANS